jgi:magnesium chelatase family protein
MNDAPAESSAIIRERVEIARHVQQSRFSDVNGIYANGDMGVSDIQKFCSTTPDAHQLLDLSVRRMQLSARAYHRILKLSRTIADLAGSDKIEVQHVAEAIQYRPRMHNT